MFLPHCFRWEVASAVSVLRLTIIGLMPPQIYSFRNRGGEWRKKLIIRMKDAKTRVVGEGGLNKWIHYFRLFMLKAIPYLLAVFGKVRNFAVHK